MAKLIEKDTTLQWIIPKQSSRGSSNLPADLILIKRISREEHGTKWNSKIIDFKKPTLAEHFPDLNPEDTKEVFRIAFSFDKEKLLIVFNPPKDVPCFKLGKNGSGRAINNSTFIDDIYENTTI